MTLIARARSHAPVLRRLGIGAAGAVAAHAITLGVASAFGVTTGHWLRSLLIGETVLFGACLAAAVTAVIRSRGSVGVGVIGGWMAGSAILAAGTVAFLVICVVFAIGAVALMVLTMLVF
jgi:hypothetical protein